MHEADTMVTDVIPTSGRHRLASSPFRRTVSRMSLGGAAVLLTMAVGALTAIGTGLTGGTSETSAGLSADGLPTQVPADPTPARTAVIGARTVGSSPAPEDYVAPTPASVVAPGEPAPVAHTAAAPAPKPIPTVRQGERCSTEGARAMTAEGKPTVCTGKRGEGTTRWRHG
jgi:hypothetical protein